MSTLFCIRDAGGIRRFRTYLTREQAEAEIERIEGPGCRAPFSVVEIQAVKGRQVPTTNRTGSRA